MESLAILVALLMLTSFLSGPIAILLTRFKSENLFITIMRRIFQALFVLVGFYISFMFLTSALSPIIHLLGVYTITTNYIALRREYFPTFFVLNILKVPIPKWNWWHSPRRIIKKRDTFFDEDGNGPSSQS